MEKITITAHVDEHEDEVYFGNMGRSMFYQRCLWLQSQGEIVSAQSKDSISNAQFDASKNALSFSRKGWKGRKKNQNKLDLHGIESDDNNSIGTSSTSMDSVASHSIYNHSNSRVNKLSIEDSRNSSSSRSANNSSSGSRSSNSKRNSLVTANKNIYTTNLKLLSPRTRFISSCMKEGN